MLFRSRASIPSRPTDKPLRGLGPFGVQASHRSAGQTKKRKRSIVISDSEGALGTPSEAEGRDTDSEEETSTAPVPSIPRPSAIPGPSTSAAPPDPSIRQILTLLEEEQAHRVRLEGVILQMAAQLQSMTTQMQAMATLVEAVATQMGVDQSLHTEDPIPPHL